MDMNFEISVATSSTMDSRAPQTVTLRVEDPVSGETICDVEMSAEEWWKVCTANHRVLPGRATDDFSRIGKELKVGRIEVPREATAGAHGDIGKIRAERWVQEQGIGDQHDRVWVHYDAGWKVITHDFVEVGK